MAVRVWELPKQFKFRMKTEEQALKIETLRKDMEDLSGKIRGSKPWRIYSQSRMDAIPGKTRYQTEA